MENGSSPACSFVGDLVSIMSTHLHSLHRVGGTARPVNWRTTLGCCLLLFAFCLSVLAQPFSIDWTTVDGGGGTSTGGVYSVSGTVGQPDASGAMSGGNYTLTGGFWALPALVQTSGAPTLSVAPAASGFALISWTPDTPGFVLQESLSPSPSGWTNSPSGSTNPVTVPAALPAKFYRLHKSGT